MNPSQRIALNATATYARAVFTAGLALFSSRWVLNALGQTDFGLFSLVGSIIGFVTFLNTVMASSTCRHFAYSIGRGDPMEVNRWFNAALGIHLGLATGLVLIGWATGGYVIAHVLTIPAERLPACLWVFRVSLLSAFASMASIPFIAMFTAQQHIAELSVWGMLQSVFTFALAYILTLVSGDRLLFYAVGMVIILVLSYSAQIIRAATVFRECRIVFRLWFDCRRLKDILSFAVWYLIGVFGGTLRNQGSAVLLNLFFGARVNAAYGIANQVSGQTDQLAASMLGALSPEITATEGRGDRSRMINYSLRACKFGSVLIILFAIPVMAEMDYILKLWLGEPPPYTAPLCQLILCTFLVDRLSAGYMLAVNAHGRIAAYQATIGTSLLLTLPLAWLFLQMGLPPTSVGAAFVIMMIVCSLGRVLWVRHLFRVPVRRWLSVVILPCAIVALAATLAAVVPRWLLPSSFLRLALTGVASIAASLLTTWLLALDPGERAFVRQNMQRLWSKIRRRRDDGAGPLPPRPAGERNTVNTAATHPLGEALNACTGCAACAAVCAMDCITMEPDAEGFLHPRINTPDCTDCGLCRQVCPVCRGKPSEGVKEREETQGKPFHVFAAWHLDEAVRRKSSSGGVFTALAEEILARGGVVVGAAFDDQLVVRHALIETPADLHRLRGSKYVQSEISPALHRQIRDLLKQGRPVLFSGTPCQVAGLRAALGQLHATLYCCDLACMGVPSPLLLRKYADWASIRADSPLITCVFRDKASGWKSPSVILQHRDRRTVCEHAGRNPYFVAFGARIALRPSCYACCYKRLDRPGDLTLGDFWGVAEKYPEYDRDDKGTSLVLVNTEKGMAWLDTCRKCLFLGLADLDTAIAGNPMLARSSHRPPQRDRFYRDLNALSFRALIHRYHLRPSSWARRLLSDLKRRLIAACSGAAGEKNA